MRRIFYIIVLAIIAMNPKAPAEESIPDADNQIAGGFNFQNSATEVEKQLITQYGQGQVTFPKETPYLKTRCYYSPSQKSWFSVDLWHILDGPNSMGSLLISRSSLCDKKYVAKKPFTPLGTTKIQLGDPKSKVLKTLGKPLSVNSPAHYSGQCKKNPQLPDCIDLKLGDEVLLYFSKKGYSWVDFYIKNNQVQSIFVQPK